MSFPERERFGRVGEREFEVEAFYVEAHDFAQERRDARIAARVTEGHVRGVAAAAQYVHVREWRLKRFGDEPGDEGDIVGDAVGQHDVARSEFEGRELVNRREA